MTSSNKELIFTNIKAISFDLDDTLYDNQPVINRAFSKLYDHLVNRYPGIKQHYNLEQFIHAAMTMKHQLPLTADLSELRRMHIRQVLQSSGYSETHDEEEAFKVFWRERQDVVLFPGVTHILEQLAMKKPLVAISNGNACIRQIGIGRYFQHSFSAADTGKPKPDKSLFLLACEKLDIETEQLLHIGDNLEKDVGGAIQAGCHAIWFNPSDKPADNHRADAVIHSLSQLLEIKFSD